MDSGGRYLPNFIFITNSKGDKEKSSISFTALKEKYKLMQFKYCERVGDLILIVH